MLNPAHCESNRSRWDVTVDRVCFNMQGQKRKAKQDALRPSKGTAPAATLSASQRRRKHQSYRSLASVPRQKKQQFIAGGDRRSVSGSDGMCFAVWQLENQIASQCILRHIVQSNPSQCLSTCCATAEMLSCNSCLAPVVSYAQHVVTRMLTWCARLLSLTPFTCCLVGSSS